MIAFQWFESGANSESVFVKAGGDTRLYSVSSDVRRFEETASPVSIISFCASVVNYVAEKTQNYNLATLDNGSA